MFVDRASESQDLCRVHICIEHFDITTSKPRKAQWPASEFENQFYQAIEHAFKVIAIKTIMVDPANR
jgi:hypothetical protein